MIVYKLAPVDSATMGPDAAEAVAHWAISKAPGSDAAPAAG